MTRVDPGGEPASARGGVGWRVWGLGLAALGAVSLVLGDFDPGQPVPTAVAGRTALACAANAFMILAGAAVQWRPFTARAAAAVAAYYLVVVVVVMHGWLILTDPRDPAAYLFTFEQLAMGAAALVVYAMHGGLGRDRSATLARLGQGAFGACAIAFGVAHFAYMDQTAPLVPKWLPPSQTFWGYATGAAHIAGGLALLTGVKARLAAILLTVMFAAFTPLVHLPLLVGDPHKAFYWTENALNLALTGAAWVMADSLSRRPHTPPR